MALGLTFRDYRWSFLTWIRPFLRCEYFVSMIRIYSITLPAFCVYKTASSVAKSLYCPISSEDIKNQSCCSRYQESIGKSKPMSLNTSIMLMLKVFKDIQRWFHWDESADEQKKAKLVPITIRWALFIKPASSLNSILTSFGNQRAYPLARIFN